MDPWRHALQDGAGNSRTALIHTGVDIAISISCLNESWEVRQMEISAGIFVFSHVWRAALCGSGWNGLAGPFSALVTHPQKAFSLGGLSLHRSPRQRQAVR